MMAMVMGVRPVNDEDSLDPSLRPRHRLSSFPISPVTINEDDAAGPLLSA